MSVQAARAYISRYHRTRLTPPTVFAALLALGCSNYHMFFLTLFLGLVPFAVDCVSSTWRYAAVTHFL